MESGISIQPMQWSGIPDIDQVETFSERDEECFREIRDVLKKYNALDRFGLTLIHTHFVIDEDEVMVESTDIETRTHTIRPMKQHDLDEQMFTITNWKLTETDKVVKRTCVCARTSQGHTGGHTAR